MREMDAFSIDQVKQRIDSLKAMSELKPEEFCEEYGLADSLVRDKKFRDKLKPTQLRKIFQELKIISREVEHSVKEETDYQETFDRTKLLKLMPMLAYAVGRDLIPKDFYDLIKSCMSQQKLKTKGDFLSFFRFMEAILAFHKFHS